MYTTYFGLREFPFRLAAHPRFLYAASHFQEVYDLLVRSLRGQKQFIVLTGEVGTGKTTLLHKLMDEQSETYVFAFVDYTTLSFSEILTAVCERLNLSVRQEESQEEKIRALHTFCLEQQQLGNSVVLLLDEGQNLQEAALEQLPSLFLSTSHAPPRVQLILAGQPELEEKLRAPQLQQLRQFISQSCRLDCLLPQEVGPFIYHRLQAAGSKKQDLFSPRAVELIARYSQGIPRVINVICDNALRIAYTRAPRAISAETVEAVLEELQLQSPTALSPQAALNEGIPSQEEHTPWRKFSSALFPLLGDRRFWTGILSGAALASVLGLLFSLSHLSLQQSHSQVVRQSEPETMPSPMTSLPFTPSASPTEDLSLTLSSFTDGEEPSIQEPAATSFVPRTPTTPAAKLSASSLSVSGEMPRQYNIGFASVDLSPQTSLKTGETTPRVAPGRSTQTVAVSKEVKERSTQRRQRELSQEERELFQAVLNDDAQLIDRLLDAGVSPNATSRGGWTPLMWATIDGRVAIAQKLLQHGASVNVKNNRGMTPLMYAAWNGQGDLARLFIEHGARIHDRDSNGATALYYAQDPLAKFTRREERPDIVNLLIAGGAQK